MKPQIEVRNIQTSGLSLSEDMGIAEGSEHIIQDVLRKKMYKDAIKSIWREYAANAYDEHVRLNKQDTPFVVTFPNGLSPKMTIRDFGRGLTDAQTMYFFGKFGASDKRDTNKLIGCYGLGNKVGHAYTDSFIVTSHLNGVKSSFNVLISGNRTGKIVKLGESVVTDEPNGVEVSIAVEPQHISNFIDKGIEVLKYFPVHPLVQGLSSEPDFGSDELITSGTSWEYYTNSNYEKAVCMMGPIAYDINVNSMNKWQREQWERELLESNLRLKVNIGDVDITSSREDLEYTDRTKAAILANLQVVKDEMVSKTQDAINNCKSEFEARTYYFDTFLHGGGFGKIVREALGRKFMWNGIEIDDATIHLYDTNSLVQNHKIVTYTMHRGRRSDSISYLAEHRITCTKEIAKNLYYDDTDGKLINYKRRAKTLFNNDAKLKVVSILQTSDKADFEKRTGLLIKDLKSYNAVTPTFVSQATGGNGSDKAKRAKHQTKVFELDLTALNAGYKAVASDNWNVKNVDVDNDDGVYLRIDRFVPTESIANSLQKLQRLIMHLQVVGINLDKPVYGVKKGVATGKLQHFDIWAKEQVEAIPNLKENLSLGNEVANAFNLSVESTAVSGKAKEYVELHEKAKKCERISNRQEKVRLCEQFNIEIPVSTKLKVLADELKADYPLIKYINTYSHDKPEVLEYLNAEPIREVKIIELAKAANI